MRKIYLFGSLALLFSACKPSVNITTTSTPGNADFRSYLAIGNSLTAGYADNSLYVTGQLNSYPERLFEQFRLVSPRGAANSIFYQPLLISDDGYPGPKKVLDTVTGCNGVSSLSSIDFVGFAVNSQDAQHYQSPGPNGEIDNIGVPGIRVADYPVPSYGSANPYAARFYNDPSTTPLAELKYRVATQHPTFFTMWLGANDVLGFATAGGVGDGTGNALPVGGNYYNSTDITPTTVFKNNYDSAVIAAIATGARGALINIPDITTIPFFTTVPANGLVLTRQGQVDSLTAAYSILHIVFKLGANYFIVQDHLGNVRQAVPGELILLTTPQDSLTCAGWGSLKPIPGNYVLTTEEIQQIKSATSAFNTHIADMANLYDLALVDMNTYLGTIGSGITFNGVTYNAKYVTGGAFSLDGVHLTPRGYALVANQIISAINAKYGSTVHPIDVNQYNGILFPTL